MQRFLVCITSSVKRFPYTKPEIYKISESASVEDVSYPENTVCFFFIKAPNKEAALKEYFSTGSSTKSFELQLVHFCLPKKEKVYFIGKKVEVPGNGSWLVNQELEILLPLGSITGDYEIIPE